MSLWTDMRDGLLSDVGAGPGSTVAGVVDVGQQIYDATAPVVGEVLGDSENTPNQPATSSAVVTVLKKPATQIGLGSVLVGAVVVWFLFFRKKG